MPSQFWSDFGKWALGSVVVFTVACSNPPEYERVEEFPEGMQIDSAKSALTDKLETTSVSNRYQADYEEVWAVTTEVANGFKKRHEASSMEISEKTGTIVLQGTHRVDRTKEGMADVERIRRWKDIFQIKVKSLDSTRTMVTVSRTVVGIPYFRLCREALVDCGSFYEPEVSNAKIEQWILTQIDESLRSSSLGGTP